MQSAELLHAPVGMSLCNPQHNPNEKLPAGHGGRRRDSARSFEEGRAPARSAVSSPAMARLEPLAGGLPPPDSGAVTPRLSGALLRAIGGKVCSNPVHVVPWALWLGADASCPALPVTADSSSARDNSCT